MATPPEDKWERRSRNLKEAGKVINGLVWGSVLIAIIAYVAWRVTFA